MPFRPISSSLPTNGDINVAPAFAAKRAWFAEKHKVTLTKTSSLRNFRHAFRPSHVNGTFIVTFFAIAFNTSASLIMSS